MVWIYLGTSSHSSGHGRGTVLSPVRNEGIFDFPRCSPAPEQLYMAEIKLSLPASQSVGSPGESPNELCALRPWELEEMIPMGCKTGDF